MIDIADNKKDNISINVDFSGTYSALMHKAGFPVISHIKISGISEPFCGKAKLFIYGIAKQGFFIEKTEICLDELLISQYSFSNDKTIILDMCSCS